MTVASGAIDVHAHYLTDSYRRALESAGVTQPDGFPTLPAWSADEAIAVMDRAGVATAMLSVSSPGIHFGDDDAARELARQVNEEGAALVAAHPDRFGLLAVLPLPDVSAAVEELDHAFDTLRADGVGLYTNVRGTYLGDPLLDDFVAELDRRGAVVVLHPMSPPGWEVLAFGRPRPMVEFPLETTRAVFNLALTGTLSRYPNIRWVVPHVGSALAVLADRVGIFASFYAGPGATVDVISELQRLYYDVAGIPLPRALPALLSLVDADRLLYGSDFPFTPAEAVGLLRDLLAGADMLDEAQRDAMFRGNALTLFGRLAAPSEAALGR